MRLRNLNVAAGAALIAAGLSLPSALAGDDSKQPRGEGAGNSHPGVLWETTSQMSMEGMPFAMPARRMQICAHKDATQPPIASDPHQKCVNSNFHRSGSTVTWTSSCQSPPMTGEGQITYEVAEAYSGTLKFTTAEGAMTIKLTGRKIGVCDKPD